MMAFGSKTPAKSGAEPCISPHTDDNGFPWFLVLAQNGFP
jgi:hypothetical protein